MGRNNQGRGKGRGGRGHSGGRSSQSSTKPIPRKIGDVYFDITSNKKATLFNTNMEVLLNHVLGQNDYGPYREELVDSINEDTRSRATQ